MIQQKNLCGIGKRYGVHSMIKKILMFLMKDFVISCFFLFMLLIPVQVSALCVKVSTANLRSGPGTNYEKMWQVYKYMPLRKVGTSVAGDWFAVEDVDGDVTWIYQSLVTSKYKCATVKSRIVNVRTGPGTKYRKKFPEPAQQYESFKVLQIKRPWVKVQDTWGNVGWIHKSYLWIH
jgi:SH3-like domain-containing protein